MPFIIHNNSVYVIQYDGVHSTKCCRKFYIGTADIKDFEGKDVSINDAIFTSFIIHNYNKRSHDGSKKIKKYVEIVGIKVPVKLCMTSEHYLDLYIYYNLIQHKIMCMTMVIEDNNPQIYIAWKCILRYLFDIWNDDCNYVLDKVIMNVKLHEGISYQFLEKYKKVSSIIDFITDDEYVTEEIMVRLYS